MNAASDIAIYLVKLPLYFLMIAVLLRFLLQLVRADFYNPISQFLVKVTNPFILPLRKIIPGVAGLDVAALFLLLALEVIGIYALSMLAGLGFPSVVQALTWSVLGLAQLVTSFYFFALLATIIVSFVAPGSRHPVIFLLHQLTEPVMAPFRKLIPPMGGLDFSPILLFIVINVTKILIGHMAVSAQLNPLVVVGF